MGAYQRRMAGETMTSRERLPRHLLNLLKEILHRRCPDLIDAVDSMGLKSLPRKEWERIRNEVEEEMSATGIEKGEVTPRGLLLEKLIDYVVENEPNEP
jgi:hypothetical protein